MNENIGKSAVVTVTVNEDNTAKKVGSGSLEVFATPMMIALMERAACEALVLDDGFTSVGTYIAVNHTSASPLSAVITATAAITAVNGRTIEFDITASDNNGEIGNAKHTRVIVDKEKFMKKAESKIKS